MCDEYDNRGCEVMDEKDQIISNLELEIDNLNARITELEAELWKRNSLNVVTP